MAIELNTLPLTQRVAAAMLDGDITPSETEAIIDGARLNSGGLDPDAVAQVERLAASLGGIASGLRAGLAPAPTTVTTPTSIPVPGRIPRREAVAERILERMDTPGVFPEHARAMADVIRERVVQELSNLSGQTQVSVYMFGTTLQQAMRDAGLALQRRGINGATVRAALGEVIDELLAAGYYNVVYQANVENKSFSNWGDWSSVGLSFSVAGNKSFDVDFETSARLSRDAEFEPHKWAIRGEETSAEKRWEAFLSGQDRILDNSNGML